MGCFVGTIHPAMSLTNGATGEWRFAFSNNGYQTLWLQPGQLSAMMGPWPCSLGCPTTAWLLALGSEISISRKYYACKIGKQFGKQFGRLTIENDGKKETETRILKFYTSLARICPNVGYLHDQGLYEMALRLGLSGLRELPPLAWTSPVDLPGQSMMHWFVPTVHGDFISLVISKVKRRLKSKDSVRLTNAI